MLNTKTLYKSFVSLAVLGVSLFTANNSLAETQVTDVSKIPLIKTTVVEGVDYTVLSNLQTKNPSVYMVMNYVCPHCEQFTVQFRVPAIVENYMKNHYKDAQFVEYHYDDSLSTKDNPYAGLARLNGVLYVTHNTKLIPEAYNAGREYLKSQFDVKVLKQFVTDSLKITPQQTENLWNSLSVDVFVKKQIQISQQYNIDQTPTFIINGKYRLNLVNISKDLSNYMKTIKGDQISYDEVGSFIASKIIAILDKTASK